MVYHKYPHDYVLQNEVALRGGLFDAGCREVGCMRLAVWDWRCEAGCCGVGCVRLAVWSTLCEAGCVRLACMCEVGCVRLTVWGGLCQGHTRQTVVCHHANVCLWWLMVICQSRPHYILKTKRLLVKPQCKQCSHSDANEPIKKYKNVLSSEIALDIVH